MVAVAFECQILLKPKASTAEVAPGCFRFFVTGVDELFAVWTLPTVPTHTLGLLPQASRRPPEVSPPIPTVDSASPRMRMCPIEHIYRALSSLKTSPPLTRSSPFAPDVTPEGASTLPGVFQTELIATKKVSTEDLCGHRYLLDQARSER